MSLIANPIDLEHYLEQAQFPTDRDQLLQYAQSHDAEQSIIAALQALPAGHQFQNASEAAKELWIPRDSEQNNLLGADSPDDE